VRDFFTDVWLPQKQASVAANTYVTTRGYVDAIVAAFGATRLQRLTTAQINAWYLELLDTGGRHRQGLSPKSVRNIHSVLRSGLKDAVKWGALRRNPANHADPPTVKTPELRTWTVDELRHFLETVKDDRLAALWTTAAMTGLRRSELLGLAWRNVNFDTARIAVVDTVVNVDSTPTLRRGETKTAGSRRPVDIDPYTVDVLRSHRRRQLEERMLAADVWVDTGLVFTRQDGTILSPDWTTRRFQRLARAADLEPIGLHGLRHGWASLGLQAGIHPRVVQERLGHSDVGITLSRYSHLVETMQADAAATVAALVVGP